MPEITSTTGAWTKYEDTIKKQNKGDSLGKEDFLKLLVAQMTHQDPTNPMKDTEFVSQLATYSGLEQQINMNKNLEKLIASNNAGTVASAVGLIGTIVGYPGEDGVLKTGQVTFLDIVGGEVNLYLDDGSYVPFSKVEQVAWPIVKPDASGDQTNDSDTPNDGDQNITTP